eukprot:3285456-Pyramimonas_sp.AAC.1
MALQLNDVPGDIPLSKKDRPRPHPCNCCTGFHLWPSTLRESQATTLGGLEMGTNTNTGGCLHRGKMILDFGVGGNMLATLEARIITTIAEIGVFFPRWRHTANIGVGVDL